MKQLTLIFLIITANCFAQQQFLPLSRDMNQSIEKQLNHKDISFHTSFKPYLQSQVVAYVNYDSIVDFRSGKNNRSYIYRKLKQENLFIVDTGDFYLTIDPLFNFEYGKDFADASLRADTTHFYKNTRGLIIRGNIGKKVSFMTSFYENQAFFPQYLDDFVREYKVAPGQGRTKSFKKTGFDYAMASGYVSYSPSVYFNFQLGHGKNFIGDGYRSLLLSDNSFNYPFIKITANFRKFQFTNLLTSFQNLNVSLPTSSTTQPRFQKKTGSFHFLSWNVHKRLQLGLFEGIIWQSADSLSNNGVFGMNFKFKVSDKIDFYSQVVLDDLDSRFQKGALKNKYGYQVGIKAFDLFTIKNLFFQTEFNQVQPYTYAHKMSSQNYAHYNQALAHPLGANFRESVSFLRYRYRSWFVELKFNYAVYGADTTGTHFGKDVFQPDAAAGTIQSSPVSIKIMPPYYIGQGIKTALTYRDFRLAYLLNPKTNLQVLIGVSNRVQRTSTDSKLTNFVYVGIRTSLTNHYYDF